MHNHKAIFEMDVDFIINKFQRVYGVLYQGHLEVVLNLTFTKA